MKELGAKAKLVYEYVQSRLEEGYPPSVREICLALGIKSTSSVHKYLNDLRDAGLIKKGNNLNRAIALPGLENSLRVPVLGKVAAGLPILAVENVEGYISISAPGHTSSDFFALKVKGESMINIGILDGDTVIVRQASSAENGDVVVALVDNEATVKRFFKEDGHYRLQPENDTMEPIIVDEVSILGKVYALYREF